MLLAGAEEDPGWNVALHSRCSTPTALLLLQVLQHTAGAFLQLLFVGFPSILVADFIFAPREQNQFHFASLFAGGARAFLWKDYLSFMIHPF